MTALGKVIPFPRNNDNTLAATRSDAELRDKDRPAILLLSSPSLAHYLLPPSILYIPS